MHIHFEGREIELAEPHGRSSHVAGFAFEPGAGEVRGRLFVQFKNKDGVPAGMGYYDDVARNVFNALSLSHSAGSFVQAQLKPYYQWTRIEAEPVEEDGPIEGLLESAAALEGRE